MKRRTLLGAAAAGTASLAGCTGLFGGGGNSRSPPLVEDRPSAVYYPTHVEGMKMTGMAAKGDYEFALMFSYPHRFWNVNGDEVEMTKIEESDTVHLMATVWDPETRTVLPETGLTVKITKGGEMISQETIYPMLSQPMGFHYGANFPLEGDGTYTVRVSVGGVNVRRTGAFRDRFGDGASTDIELDYSYPELQEISYRRLEKAGQRGAVEPMDMKMPNSLAPAESELPGTVRGKATSGDAVLVATTLDSPPAGVDGDGYLAVSARTPYNRMILPAMAMDATLRRGGETVYEGPLTRTLDPDLNYHYGAAVAARAGDELELRVPTPPQVARHEGYETAFLDMQPTSISL